MSLEGEKHIVLHGQTLQTFMDLKRRLQPEGVQRYSNNDAMKDILNSIVDPQVTAIKDLDSYKRTLQSAATPRERDMVEEWVQDLKAITVSWFDQHLTTKAIHEGLVKILEGAYGR